MSDETGRRNYTKYNKYITLMKVSDEDGDPKLIRSGEMTPNQEASLAFLNDFKKEATESEKLNQNKDTTDSTSMLFKQTEHQSQLESKHSTPALIRLTDDLITDSTSEGLEKKTFYNCRKCYFRHANRDAVLAHVKIHHQDAGCLPLPPKSNLNSPLQAGVNSKIFYMNKDFAAALFLSPKQPVQEQKLHNDSNNNQHSILLQCGGVPSPASSPPRQGKPSKETVEPLYLGGTNIQHNEATETTSSITATSNPTASTTIFNSPTTSTTNGASSFIDDASKSAIILGVTTNTNFDTDANERKEPSPFRCGHCHQVSNWKHVIQRHCRLKHSGQIQIEAFDRSSDGSAPIYRPLDFDGNNQSRRLLGSSGNVLKARQPYMPHTLSNSDSELSKNENNSLDSSVSSCNSDSEIIRLPLKSSSTTKQQKCPSCPFVSKDKLQLNFHISLHKSMQYKCNQCSYICNKKQYLSSHFKTHSKPAPNDLKEAMESSADEKPPAVVAVKVVSYCPRCPERFVNNSINLQQHLMAHCADLDFKCDICDFSTERKDILLSHSFVHTSTYQEKAEQIAKDSKEDSDYPAQKLQQIILQKDGATAWVIAENFTKSHDDEEFLPNEQLKSGSSKDSGTSTSSPGVLEKCPYCPFHSVCQKSIQHHLQYHINVSKRPEKHTCEHCDFSTSSRANLAEHTRIHFKAIDRRKSVSFLTSLDNLELIVTDSDENEDEEHRPTNTVLKSDSKVVKRCGKIEKETSSNMRRIRRSSAFKNEKKSSQPPSSHKTILVNPKTGQVIKRN